MLKQTVYKKVNYNATSYDGELRNGIKVVKEEGYLFTEDELKELIGKVWDERDKNIRYYELDADWEGKIPSQTVGQLISELLK